MSRDDLQTHCQLINGRKHENQIALHTKYEIQCSFD